MLFWCLMYVCASRNVKGQTKKETNPTSEIIRNEQSNFQKKQKNPEANQALKTTNHRLTQISKNRNLIQTSLTTLKICIELAKEGKVPNVPFRRPIQGISEEIESVGESK